MVSETLLMTVVPITPIEIAVGSGMTALIIGFVSVLLLGFGLVITYIDSRTAVEELRKRNNVYQVLLKRLHPLLWRDVLQSRQHSFVGALPIRFAQITFSFYLVKTLAGLLVWFSVL